MARISQDKIDEIKNKTDIVEIVKTYVPLNQRGKNFIGVCPFHQDHSPSMSVSRERQIFKCFSCGMAGDVFKFVSEIESISYMEAVQKLGEKLGIGIAIREYKTTERYEKEYEIMNLATSFYTNNLNTEKGLEAKKYLKQRGLDEEMQKEFSIGLSFGQQDLAQFFEKKKVSHQELEELGLVQRIGLEYKDVFFQRILFPIHNAEGKVVGYTGRIYEKEGTPKYLNSKETKIFRKGNILFNYHRAKEAVRLHKKIIIVEGNMDAIRMYVSGFKNTVALMGTSLTKEQMLLLQKLRVPVLLMLDNDSAGALATKNVGEQLEDAGFKVEIVRLSGKKDPDEYILTYGVEAMKDNIDNPISLIQFKMQFFKENKNLQDTEVLKEYIEEVLESLKKKDAITIDITLNKLADEYHLSYDILKKELSLKEEKEPIETKEQKQTPKVKKNRYDISAQHILYYMMNDPKYIKMYQKELGFFKEKEYRELGNEILYYYENHKQITIASFLTYAETSPLKEEIYQLIASINEEDLSETNMEEYLRMMKEMTWKEKVNSLKTEMKITSDVYKKESLAKEIVEFGKKIQEIRKERSVKND